MHPMRLLVVGAMLVVWSRPYLRLRPAAAFNSALLGAAVFAIWIGPDLLFGYRHHWLFENALMGKAETSIPAGLQNHAAFLTARTLACVVLVPILEELFWRGWLMRWLIDKRFLSVPLGAYVPGAFWLTVLLFSSEHGPYWEVGLAAGAIYGWWMVRTRSLADCILAHAVTNGLLSAYALLAGQRQYWL
jgi:CAAX prenyl protease-like protein